MFYSTDIARAQSTKHILLVEDNPGDIRLIREAIKGIDESIELHVAMDGDEALNYLNKGGSYQYTVMPDLILLDLNLPKKGGRIILKSIKEDSVLRRIPVIVLTISQAEDDILQCYDLHANCYIMKPFDIEKFMLMVKFITQYWFSVVTLPPKKERRHE